MVKFCEQREEEYDAILQNYEENPTLNSTWEVSIAYYGVKSLYNVVIEKYGYQENFPNDDESLFMPEEVCKLVRDQDQDGEFFDSIEDDEDLIKEQIHEESCQEKEDLDEVQHPNEQKETLVFVLPLDEDEVVQPCFPPAHEDEEVISPNDANSFVKDLSDMVDLHIDDFIQVGRRRWDVGCFIIDRDPIYDIEGSSQAKGVEWSSSEDWSCVRI
jgi:hypothetical protein